MFIFSDKEHDCGEESLSNILPLQGNSYKEQIIFQDKYVKELAAEKYVMQDSHDHRFEICDFIRIDDQINLGMKYELQRSLEHRFEIRGQINLNVSMTKLIW